MFRKLETNPLSTKQAKKTFLAFFWLCIFLLSLISPKAVYSFWRFYEVLWGTERCQTQYFFAPLLFAVVPLMTFLFDVIQQNAGDQLQWSAQKLSGLFFTIRVLQRTTKTLKKLCNSEKFNLGLEKRGGNTWHYLCVSHNWQPLVGCTIKLDSPEPLIKLAFHFLILKGSHFFRD